MVPRIWNQINPLFDQWDSCWWLSSFTQLWPVFDLLSLSVSRTPSRPRKLQQPDGGYLKVVTTLFEDISPACVEGEQQKLQGPEHWIQRTFSFCVDLLLQQDVFVATTQRWFSWKQRPAPSWGVSEESLRGSRVLPHRLALLLHGGQLEFDFYLWACPVTPWALLFCLCIYSVYIYIYKYITYKMTDPRSWKIYLRLFLELEFHVGITISPLDGTALWCLLALEKATAESWKKVLITVVIQRCCWPSQKMLVVSVIMKTLYRTSSQKKAALTANPELSAQIQ